MQPWQPMAFVFNIPCFGSSLVPRSSPPFAHLDLMFDHFPLTQSRAEVSLSAAVFSFVGSCDFPTWGKRNVCVGARVCMKAGTPTYRSMSGSSAPGL